MLNVPIRGMNILVMRSLQWYTLFLPLMQ